MAQLKSDVPARSAHRDFGENEADATSTAVPPTLKKNSIDFAPMFAESSKDDPPENFLMEQMVMRPRSMSHHLQSTKVPSRRWLHIRAQFWRSMMALGMQFHDWPTPKPPKVSFVRKIMTDTIPIEMYFYLPANYDLKIKQNPNHRYPIVVNFHGGGFTLGGPKDDKYWARVVLAETPAIFVSVGYRRAPEHPFPQPVDDCVEALLYMCSHADELHLDPSQIALSGFSSGGNLAFTVPFRLTYQYEKQSSQAHLIPERKDTGAWVPEPESPSVDSKYDMAHLSPSQTPESPQSNRRVSPSNSSTNLLKQATSNRSNLLNVPGPRSQLLRTLTQESQKGVPTLSSFNSQNNQNNTSNLGSPNVLSRTTTGASSNTQSPSSRIRIVSICAWYPLLDWTSSRAQKKRKSLMPKKALPKLFTDLFDFSYLPAPDTAGHHCSPYASPGLAPDHMVRDGLPHRIQMWLCEYDMLLAEGQAFSERMDRLGKDVKKELVRGVPHAWDKSPNPFRNQKAIDELYTRAAGYLRGVFEEANRRETVGEGIGFGGMR